MATLTVWKFSTAEGAEMALERLRGLSTQGLVTIRDAAVVSWPEGAKRPKTREAHNLAAAGALGGSFWGLLFGLIFFVPLLGLVVGAATGAIAGSLSDVGIDDDFIASVRREVTEGTSAVFLLTQDAVVDRLRDAFEGIDMQLLHTNLSSEQEAALRQVFAEEGAAPSSSSTAS